MLVGCTGVTRSTNQNSHPLTKIDFPIVVKYEYLKVHADPIRNSYFNCDFGKSRLPSLFKSVFLETREVLLLFMILILVLLRLLSVLLPGYLRLLRFILVTANCTSTDIFTYTSSTTRNCTSTTCTITLVLLVKLHHARQAIADTKTEGCSAY
jgi:hypothetical protein